MRDFFDTVATIGFMSLGAGLALFVIVNILF